MTKKWLIHFVAHCAECPWSTEDYLTGQQKASRHAEKTGHKVSADAGYIVEYYGKETRPEK